MTNVGSSNNLNARLCSYESSIETTQVYDIYDFDVTSLGIDWRDCPYCEAKMDSRANTDETNHERKVLANCDVCGYWRVADLAGVGGFRTSSHTKAYEGVVKFFDVDAPSIPILDLFRFLKKHPHHLANVNPFVFEELVAECMKAAYPNCKCTRLGGSRDRGIDLVLVDHKN